MIRKSEFGVADVPAFEPVTYRKHQHTRQSRDGKTLTYEYNIPIIICPDCSRYTIVRCGRSDGGRFGVVSNHKGLTGRLCSFSGTEIKIGKAVDASKDIDNPEVCPHLKQVGDRAVPQIQRAEPQQDSSLSHGAGRSLPEMRLPCLRRFAWFDGTARWRSGRFSAVFDVRQVCGSRFE